MSAPEPYVRVTAASFKADEYGPGWTDYDAECEGCHQAFSHWREFDVHEWARHHAETCTPLRLARLQARWDARTEALRALIEQWRSTAGVLSVHYDATGEGELRGRSKVYQIAADELERAIGGGA